MIGNAKSNGVRCGSLGIRQTVFEQRCCRQLDGITNMGFCPYKCQQVHSGNRVLHTLDIVLLLGAAIQLCLAAIVPALRRMR